MSNTGTFKTVNEITQDQNCTKKFPKNWKYFGTQRNTLKAHYQSFDFFSIARTTISVQSVR